jgi:hypothetical protein
LLPIGSVAEGGDGLNFDNVVSAVVLVPTFIIFSDPSETFLVTDFLLYVEESPSSKVCFFTYFSFFIKETLFGRLIINS